MYTHTYTHTRYDNLNIMLDGLPRNNSVLQLFKIKLITTNLALPQSTKFNRYQIHLRRNESVKLWLPIWHLKATSNVFYKPYNRNRKSNKTLGYQIA